MTKGYQIESDGRTVWINGPDGCSVARFGLFGIDIHRPFEEQQTKGACLFCTHEETKLEDWKLFKKKVREYFNIAVPRKHRPVRFSGGRTIKGVRANVIVIDEMQ